MPDPTLSDALKAAYASAPVDEVIYHTRELWHPAFSQPIRVVRDNASLDARLEATAPRNAGAIVTFFAYAFDTVPPDQDSSALPQCILTIDNVSTDITAQLEAAKGDPRPTTVIYRGNLSDQLTVGPENNPPPEMEFI